MLEVVKFLICVVAMAMIQWIAVSPSSGSQAGNAL